MNKLLTLLPRAILTITLTLSLTASAAAPNPATNANVPKTSADPLLSAMQKELTRAKSDLAKSDPGPYYLSYAAYDSNEIQIVGSYGALLVSGGGHRRSADVVMRVGAPQLDNTHLENRGTGMSTGLLPLANDSGAIERVLWQLTDREYKRASPAYLKVKTNTAVRSEEEDKSPDFSEEKPQNHVDASTPQFPFDTHAWEDRVRRLSAEFRKFPDVYSSAVVVNINKTDMTFVSSEGSSVVTPTSAIRMIIQAETRADDGMDLLRVETFQALTPDQLPPDSEIIPRIQKMASDLNALRNAPIAEPYDGPALLSGRAAAVFFHEVLGHRLEGHRQRGENEGQTFTKKVNQLVLPDFLSVADDPTMRELNGVPLAGWYQFDNEGEPAQRADVIQNGILKDFLLSRTPFKGFGQTNGHGRSQPGLMATGRQGNLIVTSTKTLPESEVRAKFIEEIKKQNKPYGLYFEDIQGGFTLTSRNLPQAFQVLPVMVWRVYADGRPDELVRGVDIVGTPLAALTHITLTGDKTDVFNGVCGAESGWVPVAAAAPEMLFSEMEVQKRSQSHNRPPILAPPAFAATDASPSPMKPATGEVKP
jgi:predicted Zn-dependent protease